MEYIKRYWRPERGEYPTLLKRGIGKTSATREAVQAILEGVKERGDKALLEYSRRFDGVELSSLRVTDSEIEEASALVDASLKQALRTAQQNIETFHRAQLPTGEQVERDGIELWRKVVPIERVGLYVPGGTAPLVSTVLMLAVPACVAGCRSIALCTPPGKDGTVDPAILWAANAVGVDEIYKVGGAQAIGAMAYGTETIGAVDKIYGPGNSWVTEAKSQVGSTVCAIDLPAGPSEVMVAVTPASDPLFVAADLLSQAEHGRDSQAMLVVRAEKEAGFAFIDRVEEAIGMLATRLERSGEIEASLANSRAFVIPSTEEMAALINAYAPEHLIISLESDQEDERLLSRVHNAGSVFLGPWSPESSGDYASGTNHTLPTAGWARSYSGLSVDSFVKKITVQRLNKDALVDLAPTVVDMADVEGLGAHRLAVDVRLEER
ncbi:MAG: histidinol dehydrogenase [Sphaerochaeta sp.]|nr:histidinol dehydrogenase [Sphaerochaeta sp.]